jgi:hypothetical protein
MVDKYKNEFEIMKTRLKEIDFYLEKENDYSLFFGNNTNWNVVLYGDKYDDYCYICISNLYYEKMKINKLGFLIWKIMKVFGIDVKNITINDELDFLIENKDKILDETLPYKEAYDNLKC